METSRLQGELEQTSDETARDELEAQLGAARTEVQTLEEKLTKKENTRLLNNRIRALEASRKKKRSNDKLAPTPVAEQAAGDLKLPPPTLVSLSDLAEHDSVDAVLGTVRDREPPYFFPRIVEHGDDHVFLYPGDAGYEAGDVSLDSPCHRTVMHKGRFTYHRNFSWPSRSL